MECSARHSQTVSYFCIGEKRIIIQYWSPVITDVIKCYGRKNETYKVE